MGSERWFRAYEAELARMEDETGVDPLNSPEASERASERATERVREEWADLADRIRDEARG